MHYLRQRGYVEHRQMTFIFRGNTDKIFIIDSLTYTLIKERYHDVENPDQLKVLAFSTLP